MSQQRVDRFLSRRFYGPAELVEAVLPNERHGPPRSVSAEINALPNLLQRNSGQLQPEKTPEKFNDSIPQGQAFFPRQPNQHEIIHVAYIIPHLQQPFYKMVQGIEIN